ncbi:hypothetical protein GQ44DRAFT_698565 [Phaeosphaeriaceae sp. PMI808]|nr:hypothetical protein GQ44DRAFT_698565 [Phaeosphaeriaceae sp. PMI808]
MQASKAPCDQHVTDSRPSLHSTRAHQTHLLSSNFQRITSHLFASLPLCFFAFLPPLGLPIKQGNPTLCYLPPLVPVLACPMMLVAALVLEKLTGSRDRSGRLTR